MLTVLMVAPVALTIAKKLKMSPVPSVIAIAISSNLQGAATLVGDTTSILLGGEANMNFLEFFWYRKTQYILGSRIRSLQQYLSYCGYLENISNQ